MHQQGFRCQIHQDTAQPEGYGAPRGRRDELPASLQATPPLGRVRVAKRDDPRHGTVRALPQTPDVDLLLL